MPALPSSLSLYSPIRVRARCMASTSAVRSSVESAHAALPALVDELLGCGGERIRHRMPDVDAAVAIEIDTVLVVFRRQELGQPGGAGPGRAHVFSRDVALAKDLQRQDEFVAVLIL